MFETQKHLLDCLHNCANYKPTQLDSLYLKKHTINKFIFKKITSKKFRKWSINEEEVEKIHQAISINVSLNKPIQLVVPFGGYKMWRLSSSPEVDWAEFFAIVYYCRYLSPIIATYKPGAILYFSSDEIVIERMNNIPKNDTDRYYKSFNILLECFRNFCPPNLKIEIRKIGELYGQDDFDTELNDLIKKTKQMAPQWDKEQTKQLHRTSMLNYKFDGARDYTKLTDEEKQKKVEESFIVHEAYRGMSQKISFVYEKNKIVIAAKPTASGGIAIGTTKNSTVKFWSGLGVLETDTKGQLANRILSYKQWQKINDEAHLTQPTYLIPLKNFATIDVYPKPHNFFQKHDDDLVI